MIAPEVDPRVTQLRSMQRRATGLLVLVALAFVAVRVVGGDARWVPTASAGLEGSLVGGLADWFAVVALFRRPLGLPIPHTAVIRERKDQFGATLAQFVQENFLSTAVVTERLRASRVAERLATWMATPEHAATVSRYAAETLVGAIDVVDDEAVHGVIDELVRSGLDAVPVAPWGGRALQLATADGRHQDLLTSVLRSVSQLLDEHRGELHERFSKESPWWLPGAVEDRIFDRLVDGGRALLQAVIEDRDHEYRSLFDERIRDLIDRLEHDPAMAERGDALKRDLLAHPELRAWSAGIWSEVKDLLRAQAGDETSVLRLRVAGAVEAAGRRLLADAGLRAKVDEAAEGAVRYVAQNHAGEITELIAGTVSRWDPDETSDKLELLLGRDLQFIRINGTVVGGLAGLAIHGLGGLLS